MWGRLNPKLGWMWKDGRGEPRPYLLKNISMNAGMVTGMVQHSGVLATRPVQDFDMFALYRGCWLPAQDVISLIPKEMDYAALRKRIVPVQIQYRSGMAPVL